MENVIKTAIKNRRILHKSPELSREEFQTSKFIKEKLMEIGIEVMDSFSGTSIVGIIRGGMPGPTIGLRADIDALAIQEVSSKEYKSQKNGVMHACGHDGHIAMLLAAGELLYRDRDRIAGNIKLIFQSAEEQYGGAEILVKEGVLEAPSVDAIYALHIWPTLEKGKIGLKEGPLMASSAVFTVNIKGDSCHGAMPQMGKDALVCAAEMVGALQSVVSRSLNPLDPAVLTIGKLNAGTAFNIIPGEASFTGTVRTTSNEAEDIIEARMKAIVKGVADACGCRATLDYNRIYPVTINSSKAIEEAGRIIKRNIGEDSIEKILLPNMTAEDFSFYLQERDGAMLWLGSKDEAYNKPLHHESFDFHEEEVMRKGIALLYALGIEAFRK
ncbi:M20 metallopeptidase family protein [Alloiococcus sp. CFN-8]|uniref:M20 metallopeptidase family protein n=1 Tax=Alloiococcus sp. CFN-8 TaxID=3416081 RepID=UPI003CED1DB0